MEPTTKRKRVAEPSGTKLFGRYLRSRYFGFTLLALALAAIGAFVLMNLGLKWYTNHGQRLEVADYVTMTVEDAERAIERNDFRMEVIDSIYLIDETPGTVLRQDPPAGSYVKESRRIYLTVTKTVPDLVTLPALAGTYELDRYVRKLALMDLTGKVRDKEFNSRYQPNTILRVYYGGREVREQELKDGYRVPRGSEIEFVVSKDDGGTAALPDLRCRSYDEARFLVQENRLRIGLVEEDATVTNPATAYIWRQEPAYAPGEMVPFDSEIAVYLTQDAPEDCGGL